ncbi:hypothetical protein ABZV58_25720 [Nocardia sp. NPDC004654]|uniref:hypothetical protein n=1 Tax=Nocardia sp. NPDC004654 TaxID=3154776 RepID=UPI0033BCFB82
MRDTPQKMAVIRNLTTDFISGNQAVRCNVPLDRVLDDVPAIRRAIRSLGRRWGLHALSSV